MKYSTNLILLALVAAFLGPSSHAADSLNLVANLMGEWVLVKSATPVKYGISLPYRSPIGKFLFQASNDSIEMKRFNNPYIINGRRENLFRNTRIVEFDTAGRIVDIAYLVGRNYGESHVDISSYGYRDKKYYNMTRITFDSLIINRSEVYLKRKAGMQIIPVIGSASHAAVSLNLIKNLMGEWTLVRSEAQGRYGISLPDKSPIGRFVVQRSNDNTEFERLSQIKKDRAENLFKNTRIVEFDTASRVVDTAYLVGIIVSESHLFIYSCGKKFGKYYTMTRVTRDTLVIENTEVYSKVKSDRSRAPKDLKR